MEPRVEKCDLNRGRAKKTIIKNSDDEAAGADEEPKLQTSITIVGSPELPAARWPVLLLIAEIHAGGLRGGPACHRAFQKVYRLRRQPGEGNRSAQLRKSRASYGKVVRVTRQDGASLIDVFKFRAQPFGAQGSIGVEGLGGANAAQLCKTGLESLK